MHVMSTFINCPLFNNVVFLWMKFPHNIPYRPSILITGSLLYATLLHAADEDNGSCTQSIFIQRNQSGRGFSGLTCTACTFRDMNDWNAAPGGKTTWDNVSLNHTCCWWTWAYRRSWYFIAAFDYSSLAAQSVSVWQAAKTICPWNMC